jgi:hypothetical protein
MDEIICGEEIKNSSNNFEFFKDMNKLWIIESESKNCCDF